MKFLSVLIVKQQNYSTINSKTEALTSQATIGVGRMAATVIAIEASLRAAGATCSAVI